MIDLLDRGSLKYPSESVFESVLIIYEIFLKIDSSSRLSRLFYEGSCRRNLVHAGSAQKDVVSIYNTLLDDPSKPILFIL